MARATERSSRNSPPRVDIISIGTLGRNLIWGEQQVGRTQHATTSLIRAAGRHILVDPSLPPPALGARIFERTGFHPDRIDTVFLTNFNAARRGGLSLFRPAKVLIHEPELQWARGHLEALIEQAPEDDVDRRQMEAELRLLESLSVADDKLAEGVDLFPLPGPTPGTCGLLVASPLTTTLIAGDAIATLDHFLAGQILPDARDVESAQESFREVYEIADVIVPGYDNIFTNPRASGM